MQNTDCPLCASDTSELNMHRVCCRVRFLLRLPNVTLRRGWLERWKDWPEIEKVKDELKARWEARGLKS